MSDRASGDYMTPRVGDVVQTLDGRERGVLVAHGGDHQFRRISGMGWAAVYEPVDVKCDGQAVRLRSPKHAVVRVIAVNDSMVGRPYYKQVIHTHLRGCTELDAIPPADAWDLGGEWEAATRCGANDEGKGESMGDESGVE